MRSYLVRKLSNKSVITNSLGTIFNAVLLIGFAFLSLLAAARDIGFEVDGITAWLVFLVIAAITLSILYSTIWVKLFGYTLEENEVKIERGVISKSYDSIPYSRIQNVGIERSLLERMLSISTVNIQTAGASGVGSSEGNIAGVDKEIAEQVREDIMDKARQDNQNDGV